MSEDKREIVQKEAYQKTLEYKRLSLVISMRLGKTRIGCMKLKSLYDQDPDFRALIVAPKVSIYESWKDELKKLNMEYILNNIKFSTYISLQKQHQEYDIVILDEVHQLRITKVDWLNSYNGLILGLTGTPPVKNSNTARLINIFCPVKYTYMVSDAVDENILNDYRIMIHEVKLSDKKNLKVNMPNGGYFYTSEIENYKFWSNKIFEATSPKQRQIASVMRMKMMQEYPSKMNYAKDLLSKIEDKCIVFVNTKEQADDICTKSYHSGNPDSNVNLLDFKAGEIDKLSCVLQINEGITIEDLKQGIITHFYSNNSSKGLQRWARLLGLSNDDLAICHILCFEGTVDEDWVDKGLESLDQNKIKYVKF